MKNIHVIPTSQSSKIVKDDFGKLIFSINIDQEQNHFSAKNIYITNLEEIKDGDWYFLSKENKTAKCSKGLKLSSVTPEWCQKIILTTDEQLIKDGVQSIDDEFIEWFIKNQGCEKVEVIPYLKDILNPLTNEKYPAVQHNHFDETKMICKYQYEIIIPKEETQGYICPQTKIQCDDECCVSAENCNILPSTDVFSEPKQEIDMSKYTIGIDPYDKQEALEEVAERIGNNFEDSTFKAGVIYGVIEGAKWQAERMYSEEEVLDILHNYRNHFELYRNLQVLPNMFFEWFEKFKKK